MKLEFNAEYTLTLQEIVLTILLSVLAGAVTWIVAPMLIFIIAVGFIIYVAFTIYDAITRRTTKKVNIEG